MKILGTVRRFTRRRVNLEESRRRIAEYEMMQLGFSPITGEFVGKNQALKEMCEKYPFGIYDQLEKPIDTTFWMDSTETWTDKS